MNKKYLAAASTTRCAYISVPFTQSATSQRWCVNRRAFSSVKRSHVVVLTVINVIGQLRSSKRVWKEFWILMVVELEENRLAIFGQTMKFTCDSTLFVVQIYNRKRWGGYWEGLFKRWARFCNHGSVWTGAAFLDIESIWGGYASWTDSGDQEPHTINSRP